MWVFDHIKIKTVEEQEDETKKELSQKVYYNYRLRQGASDKDNYWSRNEEKWSDDFWYILYTLLK